MTRTLVPVWALLCLLQTTLLVVGFAPVLLPSTRGSVPFPLAQRSFATSSSSLSSTSSPTATNTNAVVQATITVSGKNIHAGPYYRTVVKHEATFLRKLRGTLNEDQKAGTTEIVVCGPQKTVEGFVRWVQKGPGLGQLVKVENVAYVSPPAPDVATLTDFTEGRIVA